MINKGFKTNVKGELTYLTIPSIEQTGLVKHCFTTRLGGVSEGVYRSLNTSLTKEDAAENVIKNLDTICSAIHVDYRKLVSGEQTHHDIIQMVTEKDIGKHFAEGPDGVGVDALMTNVPGIPMITYYADCVPVFILDTANRAAALVHSGWRGTVLKIAAKTLRRMKEVYGTNPADCLVGIGPSLEMKCFDVHEDTMLAFKEAFKDHEKLIQQLKNGKYTIDLWQAITSVLIDEGVPSSNITISGLCTKCHEDMFFSYRRDNGKTGSLSAILEILYS